MGSHRRGHYKGRWEESVFILVVFAEEAGIKAVSFSKLGLLDNFIHTAVQVFPMRGVSDRAVNAELHVPP
jgi:hypothetical protein